jgi:hypothetical protein
MDKTQLKVYKTFQELYKNRPNHKPFIMKTQYDETIIIPVNDETFVVQDNKGNYKEQLVKKQVLLATAYISDYLPLQKKAKHKCTCDFVSVILVSGCKCGGI